MKQKIYQKITILLLIFIGYFQYNLIMNRHVHLINGHVISHSHPYQTNPIGKSPYQSHSHSALAFFLLDQISNTSSTVVLFSEFLAVLFLFIRAILPLYAGSIPSPKYLFYHSSRPPPKTVQMNLIPQLIQI
jgi:hypothetical protein